MKLLQQNIEQLKQTYTSMCQSQNLLPKSSLFKGQKIENELDFSHKELNPADLKVIFNALKQLDYFKTLNCQHNNLGNEALDLVIEYIKSGNINIQAIYLENNNIQQQNNLPQKLQKSVQSLKSILTVYTDFGTFSNLEALDQNDKSVASYKQEVMRSIHEIDQQLMEYQTQSTSENTFQQRQTLQQSSENQDGKITQNNQKERGSKARQLINQNIISYGVKKDIQQAGYCNKYYAFRQMNEEYEQYLQTQYQQQPDENLFFPNLSYNATILNLRNAQITGISQEVLHYNSLQTVCLADNLIFSIPQFPAQLTVSINFKALELKKNRIQVIQNLDNLVMLKQLDLSFNMITEIQNLFNLKSLKELNLGFNLISKVQNMEHLKITHLSLEVNQLTQFINIRPISYNVSLIFLALQGNPFSQDQFYVGKVRSLLPKLQVLDYFKLNNVNNGPSFRFKLDPVKYFFTVPFMKNDRTTPQNKNIIKISTIIQTSNAPKQFSQSLKVKKSNEKPLLFKPQKTENKQKVSLTKNQQPVQPKQKRQASPIKINVKTNQKNLKKQKPDENPKQKKVEKPTQKSNKKPTKNNIPIDQLDLKPKQMSRTQTPNEQIKFYYDKDKLLEILRSQRIFKGMPKKFFISLLKFLKIKFFQEKEVIRKEGEVNDDMFIIVQGKIGYSKQRIIYKEINPIKAFKAKCLIIPEVLKHSIVGIVKGAVLILDKVSFQMLLKMFSEYKNQIYTNYPYDQFFSKSQTQTQSVNEIQQEKQKEKKKEKQKVKQIEKQTSQKSVEKPQGYLSEKIKTQIDQILEQVKNDKKEKVENCEYKILCEKSTQYEKESQSDSPQQKITKEMSLKME